MKENLRNKRGFVWNHKWFSNSSDGHERNALRIIKVFKSLYPAENWEWYKEGSAQDFLVLKKKAIQIGNGNRPNCIIAAGRYYSTNDMEKFMEDYNLHGYTVILIW